MTKPNLLFNAHESAPQGYRFCGLASGIKENGKLDLAMIVSDRPAKAVAVFTTNRLQAAPVLQGKKVLKKNLLRAIVANSGNANAATGLAGLKNAEKTAQATAKALGVSADQVLVSSTGKIGVPLPLQKIEMALPQAISELSETGMQKAAEAIMTTDAFPKIHQVSGKIKGKTFTVSGFAKGAGMIEPHMATMLAYIMTDLDLKVSEMKQVFKKTVDKSFNAISVDGDCSTNDTAVLLANGASGINLNSKTKDFKRFEAALLEVCQKLARMMVEDGEGATKVVEIKVRGAKSDLSAKKIAYSIARSQLVKTSFFGQDPNWGRVFAAVGYSGESFDPAKVDIYYGKIPLVRRGAPTGGDSRAQAHEVMKSPSFKVLVDLKTGKGEAELWTSDLGYEYVKINAEYN